MGKIQSAKRLINSLDFNIRLLGKGEYQKLVYTVVNRYRSQWFKPENMERDALINPKEESQSPIKPNTEANSEARGSRKFSSDEDIMISNYKWKPELTWFTKALEPALLLCRWVLPSGNGLGDKLPPSNRSFSEIFASIQRSKIGLQDWSLSDLTIGLYLIYLQQASKCPAEDINGEIISSESTVHDLIYHTELAKGAYKDSARTLAKISMLRESNVVKFVPNSSLLRPGYYIGVDQRKKLVILVIRGTQTVYDLVTDILSSSDEEMTFDGYTTHFGSAEAARWFLQHEMETIRKCLQKHEGFRLRLVGHSLGGATASLIAIMLHQKSIKELGFNPEIVSAIGYATPPCVSKELAESCSGYVTTVVMQNDIIPRLSVASLTRLRNEILQMDWVSIFEKEDHKRVVNIVNNAKQIMSSMQDVARKLAHYAKFRSQSRFSDNPRGGEVATNHDAPAHISSGEAPNCLKKEETACLVPEELFVPGSLYYLKRNMVNGEETFTLLKRHPGEHFQRILLSSYLISDHKCDTVIYALRDVLKGFPGSYNDHQSIFR